MAEVICEGYLTKSPPEHKINRARWCRRYFRLCSSVDGERIVLQYYKDKSLTKLKGTINLRECEQVDQGLSFETKSKLRDAHIFDIVTRRRKYFLVTETETDMLRWVQSICTACGFQSEDTLSDVTDGSDRYAPEVAARLDSTAGAHINSTTSSVEANGISLPRYQLPTTLSTCPDESYIPLDECNTGPKIPATNGTTNAHTPIGVVGVSPQQQGKWDTMSSSSSSAPSDTPPSPPESRPTSQIGGGIQPDIYDVPPVKQSNVTQVDDDAPPIPRRPSTVEDSTRESIYKAVPAARPLDPMSWKFDRQISSSGMPSRGSFSNSEGSQQAYDLVRSPSTNSPSMSFEQSLGAGSSDSETPQSNYEVPPPRPPPLKSSEIYQVPPVRPQSDGLSDSMYDVPPVSPHIESTYDVLPSPLGESQQQPVPCNIPPRLTADQNLSKSTDDLARSFEEISQHNAHHTFTNGEIEHSTYDAVPPMDLNSSIGSNSSFNAFRDIGPSSTAREAPPRPAKPAHMSNLPKTPPPSMEETYSVPPQTNHHISVHEVRQRLSSVEASSSAIPHVKEPQPPSIGNHHTWLEQPIPVSSVSYMNTPKKHTFNNTVRPNTTYHSKGYLHMRSNTVTGPTRMSAMPLGYQNTDSSGLPLAVNGHQPPGSYLAMQGSTESPKGGINLGPLGGASPGATSLGAASVGPISEECYMPMQSQNEGSGEVYTAMNSPMGAPVVPRRPPRPSTSSTVSISSTISGDSIPPPVDRSSKPRSTDSTILNPDIIGLEGSFYATGSELPPDFPVQSTRTKSFSKRTSRHRVSQDSFPSTPPRRHRTVHSSTSSHDASTPPFNELYSVPPSATSLTDESYVFTDPPPTKPRIDTRHASIDSGNIPHPSPTFPPRSRTVEYLELDHDSDSQTSTLPRPPKSTSPKDKVEYIHLDMEKTKALQEVTQVREECYKPKNIDSLKK